MAGLSRNPDQLLVDFPRMKLRRVTYRYRGELKRKVEMGDIASSTAARRMSSVVALYRWLINEGLFIPENAPWEERTFNLRMLNSHGQSLNSVINSADLRISSNRPKTPFDGLIEDGGKLRPLPVCEQKILVQAAATLGNGEMYLLLLFMLLTGARVQTAGTLRVGDFTEENVKFSQGVHEGLQIYKLRTGPGTGIYTKRDKQGILHVPLFLFQLLRTYAVSERAH